MFPNLVSVTSMTISLVSSQQPTTHMVLHLKTRPQMLLQSLAVSIPSNRCVTGQRFFSTIPEANTILCIKTHHGAFRILLGKMTVGKQKSNEVMSIRRTSLRSLKPSPSCTLSHPIQPLPRDCLSQSISFQDHPVHGEVAGNSCCTTTPSLCQSCPSRAGPKLQLPCSSTMPGQLRLHLS